MKNRTMRSLVFLLAMGGLLLATGCEEESDGSEERAQEQRYFDLYISSTFKDTIAPPTGSGLYFVEVTEGTGDKPDTDDWLLVNYVGYIIPEELVVDTYFEHVAIDHGIQDNNAMYGPFKLQNGSRNPGLTEGFTMMQEGGEAIMCFTSDLGYGAKGTDLMNGVPGYKSMKYEVELLEVIKDMDAYEQAKIEAFVDTIPGADTIHEPTLDVVMYYVVDEPNSEGSPIANDSLVEIAYRGYLPDGREFDASAEGESYDFVVGDYADRERSPIVGWHLGVTRFREGEKGRLIIPYQMGYGEAGSFGNGVYAIQPYETLVFDIEVVNVEDADTSTEPEVN
jgi:FKBP-type peptidyl-prolyl cis-trans isomerase